MASLKGKVTGGAGFTNEAQIVRVVYDFAVDGGATGSLDMFVCDTDCIVKLKGAIARAAVTSGGSMTLSAGKATAGTGFLSAIAVASLTLNSIQTSSAAIHLAAGDKLDMTIGAAAATAGKIEFIFEILK